MIDALVCTNCAGALLDRDSFYECEDCAARYGAKGGVACFKPSARHHGEIPEEALRRLLREAPRDGWRAAYRRAAEARPRRDDLLLAGGRARFLEELALGGEERALDFGCGLGAITVELARRVAHVTALDAVYESAAFVDLRCRQDGIANVTACCCGDPLELPFPDDHFDLVIVNGVLEYVPLAVVGSAEAQRLALASLARVLKPGGRLYARACWPAPGLQFPRELVPLEDRAALGRYVRRVPGRVKRAALAVLYRLGALAALVPDFSILAEKAPRAPSRP